MGSGDVALDDLKNHFTVEAKAVFDWLPTSLIEQVAPYDSDGGAACNPCVVSIQAADAGGALDTSTPVAIQIETSTDDYFLFIEYRADKSGALLTYSSFASSEGISSGYDAGLTGIFGNSLVIDGHPETLNLRDATLGDGEDILLDVGLEAAPRPLMVYFRVVGALLEVSLHFRRADIPPDRARRRRGCDVDIPSKPVRLSGTRRRRRGPA